MFSMEEETHLIDDREDLIALLRLRFGPVPPAIIERIYKVDGLNELERLILAAANASDWKVFVEELHAGNHSFKLVGERFNPISGMEKSKMDSAKIDIDSAEFDMDSAKTDMNSAYFDVDSKNSADHGTLSPENSTRFSVISRKKSRKEGSDGLQG